MNDLKNHIRFILGNLIQSLKLQEVFRVFYFRHALSFLRLHQNIMKKAWIRRSLVTRDFVPFWSDIDLTIMINDSEEELQTIHRTLRPDFLVQDLQIISPRFFLEWEKAGGFRNRQSKTWKDPITNHKISRSPFDSRNVLAFEMAHEIYLLYRQLETNLYRACVLNDLWAKTTIWKLCAELERVRLYWENPNETILHCSRLEILSKDFHLKTLLALQDSFWKTLLNHLEKPLNEFNLSLNSKASDEFGESYHFEMDDKIAFAIHSWDKLKEALQKKTDHFIASRNFLTLVKGVGVHEQTFLNQLAKNKTSYYFLYNKQRLAHDLIGCIALSPDNLLQLFYCLKNIREFTLEVAGLNPPSWDKINSEWHTNRRFSLSQPELITLASSYLDLLAAIS